MSEHTPGPWIYDIHEHSFYIFDKGLEMVADGDPDDIGIARMRGVGRGADAPEQESNARLISAAPDLLNACKHALTIFNEYDETGFAGTIVAKKLLTDAIAKAEGK